jgi:CMP-N-acetylneuraminic acid synthetase
VKNLLHRVIVSTDDEEIASVSIAAGAEVPFMRPHELAKDDTKSLPVLQHAVTQIEEEERDKTDWVLLLQPTSPFRTAEDIENSIRLLDVKYTTSVIGVFDASDYHPRKMYKLDKNYLVPYDEKYVEGMRRQDMKPPVYKTNGAIYLVGRDVLMNEGTLFGKHPRPMLMPVERSLDIDTEYDLLIAEAMIRKNKGLYGG